MNNEKMSGILQYHKIVITGAAGMLGSAFSLQLKKYASSCEVIALTKQDWDVTDQSKIAELANRLYGCNALILHCAALVNVELCAENPVLARDVIVNGTKNVIKLAKLVNAKIVYPQTFLIYDGLECPINELTQPNPQSKYASLKLQAEEAIFDSSPDNLVIRMAGFFGGEEKDKNFVGKIIPMIVNAMADKKTSFEVGDRIWQPTFTNDLALNTILLCSNNKFGIYIMSSIGEASFWDVACEITKILGWHDLMKIKKISSENFSKHEAGKRPTKAILSNERLNSECLNVQRTWQQSLKEYLSGAYFDQFRKVVNTR